MVVILNCPHCGQVFKKSTQHRKFCSKDCARKYNSERRINPPKESGIEKIEDITRQAAKLGLSYGKYVSRFGL